jgi:hypothetical protein
MKKISIQIAIRDTDDLAKVITIDAYLTPTPGLVIHEITGDADYCWVVTHAVSGLRLPWTFDEPEIALTFCRILRGAYPWHQAWNADEVARDRVYELAELASERAKRVHELGGAATLEPAEEESP